MLPLPSPLFWLGVVGLSALTIFGWWALVITDHTNVKFIGVVFAFFSPLWLLHWCLGRRFLRSNLQRVIYEFYIWFIYSPRTCFESDTRNASATVSIDRASLSLSNTSRCWWAGSFLAHTQSSLMPWGNSKGCGDLQNISWRATHSAEFDSTSLSFMSVPRSQRRDLESWFWQVLPCLAFSFLFFSLTCLFLPCVVLRCRVLCCLVSLCLLCLLFMPWCCLVFCV